MPVGVSIGDSGGITTYYFEGVRAISLLRNRSIGKGARGVALEDYDDASSILASGVLPLPLVSRALRLRRRRLRSSFYIT